MRIAYMLTSLGIGGAERQVVELAERMATRGHQVALIVLRPRLQHEWSTTVEVVRLGVTKSPLGVVGGLLSGRKFLRRFKPEILHSHTFPANVTARLLRLANPRTKVLSTIHNIYEGDWKRTLVYRLTYPLSAHTTAVSRAVADRHVQIGAVPPGKLTVITNGIDIGLFNPQRTHGMLRAEPVGSGFVWLAAGRSVRAKDFANLLSAFALVRRTEPLTELWIAGERDAGCIKNADAPLGVRWLGLCEDMAGTLQAADAFVLSSAWEGMPLVVAEAMAMEKPVVATDVGGVRELVGNSGILVPPKMPAALSEAMIRIMRMSKYDRRELGRSARARIVRHFNIDAKTDQWESLYADIIGSRRAGEPRPLHGRLMSEIRDEANG